MIIVQSFVALALVLGLVWLFYRLFMLLQAKLGLSGPERSIRVEERTSLGDKRQLLLVSVEGQRFLLGATSHQISLVSNLEQKPLAESEDEQSAIDEDAQADSMASAKIKPFRRILGEIAQ